MVSQALSALHGALCPLSSTALEGMACSQQKLLCHHATHTACLAPSVSALQKLLFEVSYFELKEKTEERYYRFREDFLMENDDSSRSACQ